MFLTVYCCHLQGHQLNLFLFVHHQRLQELQDSKTIPNRAGTKLTPLDIGDSELRIADFCWKIFFNLLD